MGLTLGGLGVLSFNNGFQSPWDILTSPNFRSVASLFFFIVFIGVIAYLTNPSESSFRTFLTELSFRHHLTRLNSASEDTSSDAHGHIQGDSSSTGNINNGNTNVNTLATRATQPKSNDSLILTHRASNLHHQHHQPEHQRFHFSSRASVSLRTPAHVFRSFGLFTFAIVSPVTPVNLGVGVSGFASVGVKDAIQHSHAHKDSGNTGSCTTNSVHSQQAQNQNPSPIAGSWFIGAFGLWWMGGRVVQRSRAPLSLRSRKGEEVGVVPSRVGLLGFRSLDSEDGYEGFKLIADPFHNPNNALVPPRGLRNRSSSRSGPHHPHSHHPTHNGNTVHGHKQQVSPPLIPQRSITPPPLPVSASLPLHTKRGVSNIVIVTPDHAKVDLHLPVIQPPPLQAPTMIISTPSNEPPSPPLSLPPLPPPPSYAASLNGHRPPSRQPSSTSLLESSPLINDLMGKLSESQSSVHELRAQLSAFEESAAVSRGLLEREVEVQRVKKRAEDGVRAELRARMKVLEEEKRNAEGVKREGEKRFRGAYARREEVLRRLEKLRDEIGVFQKKIVQRGHEKVKSRSEREEVEREVGEKIEHAKREIEVCEKVLHALNERVRELDVLVGEERAKVEGVKERAERRREVVKTLEREIGIEERRVGPMMNWPPYSPPVVAPTTITTNPRSSSSDPGGNGQLPNGRRVVVNGITTGSIPGVIHRGPQMETQAQKIRIQVQPPKTGPNSPTTSPRPASLSLGNLSNLLPLPVNGSTPNQESKYHPSAAIPIPTAPPSFHSRFSPFDIEQRGLHLQDQNRVGVLSSSPISPIGTSLPLIPSGLMESPRSLEMENEAFFNALSSNTSSQQRVSSTPDGTVPDAFNYGPHVPFESSYQNRFDAQRVVVKPPVHLSSAPPMDPIDLSSQDDKSDGGSIRSRRWFSKDKDGEKEKSKKGLNPDAKIFNFSRSRSIMNGNPTSGAGGAPPPPPVDPLNPSGPPSTVNAPQTPRTSFFTSLRAFQPSPAEREALRLAMESSNNSSLERISSRGSHHSGHSPTTTSPLMHNPFALSRPTISRPQLGGKAGSSSMVDFGGRHPWTSPSSSPGEGVLNSTSGEPSSASAPPHKKSFSFNPWSHDKLLGNK